MAFTIAIWITAFIGFYLAYKIGNMDESEFK